MQIANIASWIPPSIGLCRRKNAMNVLNAMNNRQIPKNTIMSLWTVVVFIDYLLCYLMSIVVVSGSSDFTGVTLFISESIITSRRFNVNFALAIHSRLLLVWIQSPAHQRQQCFLCYFSERTQLLISLALKTFLSSPTTPRIGERLISPSTL